METKNIFIVGCARTGTSLLRTILNNSDKIFIVTETHFLYRLIPSGRRSKPIKQIGSITDDRNVDKFIEYVYSHATMSSYWKWLDKNVDRQEFKERLLAANESEASVFSMLLHLNIEKTLGRVSDDLIIGEKTPGHIYHVPTLLEWFPQAKIIHTFRDPRAITASRIKKVKKKHMDLKSRYPHLPGWALDPLDVPAEIVHMSREWFNAIRLHTRYKELYPQNYYFVRYEDLITDPETQLKQLCQNLDIPFDASLLGKIQVVGSSYQEKQRGPSGFDKQAIDRWRETLNPLAKLWFGTVARKQLKKFGYIP